STATTISTRVLKLIIAHHSQATSRAALPAGASADCSPAQPASEGTASARMVNVKSLPPRSVGLISSSHGATDGSRQHFDHESRGHRRASAASDDDSLPGGRLAGTGGCRCRVPLDRRSVLAARRALARRYRRLWWL